MTGCRFVMGVRHGGADPPCWSRRGALQRCTARSAYSLSWDASCIGAPGRMWPACAPSQGGPSAHGHASAGAAPGCCGRPLGETRWRLLMRFVRRVAQGYCGQQSRGDRVCRLTRQSALGAGPSHASAAGTSGPPLAAAASLFLLAPVPAVLTPRLARVCVDVAHTSPGQGVHTV